MSKLKSIDMDMYDTFVKNNSVFAGDLDEKTVKLYWELNRHKTQSNEVQIHRIELLKKTDFRNTELNKAIYELLDKEIIALIKSSIQPSESDQYKILRQVVSVQRI